MTTSYKTLRLQLLWRPLNERKTIVFQAMFALLISSFVQVAILLILGPLFESILGESSKRTADLLAKIPSEFRGTVISWFATDLSQVPMYLVIPTLLVGLGLIKGLSGYIYQYSQQKLAIGVSMSYRKNLFRRVLHLPYVRLQKSSAAKWMSIIMNDVNVLQSKFTELTTNLVRDLVTVMVGILTMIYIHPISSLFLFVVAPPLAFVMGRVGRKVSRYADGWQQDLGVISERLLIVRKRLEFVRAHGGEAWEESKFNEASMNYYKRTRASLIVRSGFAPWLEFFGFSFFCLLLILIGKGFWFENFDSIKLLQFFAALGMMIRPLRNIGEQVTKLHETMGALRQGLSIFRESVAVNISKQQNPPTILGALVLNHIEVGYEGGSPLVALSNVHVEPGTAIAIIGGSGSGKSTLIKTLAGLIPPLSAEGCSIESIAASTSYVSQKPFLFKGSLRENLSYGLDDVDDTAMIDVLQLLGLQEALGDQPLDLVVDPTRQLLSGGQMQRIVLARSLISDMPIELFDEVASALDPEKEAEVTNLIIDRAKKKRKITFFVTHRMGHLTAFDEVWFLSEGELKLAGSHQKLMENPEYSRFVKP